MLEQAERFEFAVSSLGCLAARHLSEGVSGRVLAVFDSSFYVETGAGLACIGHRGLPAGPLNLASTASAGTSWIASGLRPDMRVAIANLVLWVGPRFAFPLAGAAVWRPEPPVRDRCNDGMRAGLVAFRHHMPGDGCTAGELAAWLAPALGARGEDDVAPSDVATSLVGRGEGLTPSGDDVLAGAMVALHALGEADVARRLWPPVRRLATAAGNPISLAHLEAASLGLASAAIHRALAAIVEGRSGPMRGIAVEIDAIGHTSGWDAMAGIVTVVEAWLSHRLKTIGESSRHRLEPPDEPSTRS